MITEGQYIRKYIEVILMYVTIKHMSFALRNTACLDFYRFVKVTSLN